MSPLIGVCQASRTILLNVADIIQARPPDSIWRCLTELGRGLIVGLYETLLATLAVTRGESTIENGLKNREIAPVISESPHPADSYASCRYATQTVVEILVKRQLA